FFVLGLAAACVMMGFLYRFAAPVLFLAFTYFFLLDQTRYMNHLYLICLISFLMCFLPAERRFQLTRCCAEKSGQTWFRRGRFFCFEQKSAYDIFTAASPNSTAIGYAAASQCGY